MQLFLLFTAPLVVLGSCPSGRWGQAATVGYVGTDVSKFFSNRSKRPFSALYHAETAKTAQPVIVLRESAPMVVHPVGREIVALMHCVPTHSVESMESVSLQTFADVPKCTLV